MTDLKEIKLVPGPSARRLGKRQLIDYREHREVLLSWLLEHGKKTKNVEDIHELQSRERLNVWTGSNVGYGLIMTGIQRLSLTPMPMPISGN